MQIRKKPEKPEKPLKTGNRTEIHESIYNTNFEITKIRENQEKKHKKKKL